MTGNKSGAFLLTTFVLKPGAANEPFTKRRAAGAVLHHARHERDEVQPVLPKMKFAVHKKGGSAKYAARYIREAPCGEQRVRFWRCSQRADPHGELVEP